MEYKEALSYIQNTAKFSKRKGLDRIEKILSKLGNPHLQLRCIHVAGTNGKGSTTAMISSILKAQGYKVGMYTSPYLEEFEERIQINGINIPKSRLCEVVTQVSKAVDYVVSEGYEPPTEFEIITTCMFLYFHKEAVDFAVVEVGLGGRFDPTNVITPIVSVITSISYDHMAVLGYTLKEIAYEKAGIIKPSIPVVCYPQKAEAMEVIAQVAADNNCSTRFVDENCGKLMSINGRHQQIFIRTKFKEYELDLALLGEIQILNSTVVINTIETLSCLGISISESAIYEGLKNVTWKGRMEIMRTNPVILLDGAHNIDGIDKLQKGIEQYFKYRKLYLIIGILTDKQIDEMLKIITPMAERVIAVTPNSERAEQAEALKEKVLCFNPKCDAYSDYQEAYRYALSLCEEEDLLVVCGSLYMIGDIRKIIKDC